MNGMWYWSGMGLWGWFMMAGFWILVVALIVWAVRASSRGTTEPDRALHTLEDRFARGEIDVEEFDRRRQHLLDSRQPRNR